MVDRADKFQRPAPIGQRDRAACIAVQSVGDGGEQAGIARRRVAYFGQGRVNRGLLKRGTCCERPDVFGGFVGVEATFGGQPFKGKPQATGVIRGPQRD